MKHDCRPISNAGPDVICPSLGLMCRCAFALNSTALGKRNCWAYVTDATVSFLKATCDIRLRLAYKLYKQQSTSLSPYFPFSDGGLLASFSTRLPFAIPRVRTDSYQKAVDLGPILAYQITLQIQISIPGQRINSTVQSPDCAHK